MPEFVYAVFGPGRRSQSQRLGMNSAAYTRMNTYQIRNIAGNLWVLTERQRTILGLPMNPGWD